MFNSHVKALADTYLLIVDEDEWNKITFQADIAFVEEETENEE